MGDIRLSVGQVNITNHMLINFREVQAPLAIVRSLDIFPVPASFNLFEAGFNDVVHYIDFRDSPDGVALGSLIATFVYDVKTQTLLGERRYYTVDGGGPTDPVSGTMVIVDPYLDGKTVSGFFKEGYRYLVPTTEWTHAVDTVTALVGGPFQPQEVISLEITYTANVASSSGQSFPIDIVEIAADTALGSGHYNMVMEANGSGSILTVTFPDFLTIPDRTLFAFTTEKGAQRYLAIEFINGDFCQVDGQARTIIWLGKGEQLTIMKKGAYARVVNWTGDKNRVGEIVKADKAPLNGLAEVGGWYDIDEYPRFYEWYINDLSPDLLGAAIYPASPTAADQAKFCVDLISNKFWMPDTGGQFDRNTDPVGDVDTGRSAGDRKPGTLQSEGVGTFSANVTGRQVALGGGNGGVPNAVVLKGTLAPPFTGGTEVVNGILMVGNSSETRPKNVNRNVYRII